MKNKKTICLMWLLALAPVAMVVLAWPHLPQQVPFNPHSPVGAGSL